MSVPRALCIHDLSCVGRCSLGVILPVLSACGVEASALPTALLSTHTGGLGTPARLSCAPFAAQALAHYEALGLRFDCVYSGYLAGAGAAQLVRRAHELWPAARKVVDPVLGDAGRAYRFVDAPLIEAMRALCRSADLIAPNVTESALLLDLPADASPMTADAACARMDALRRTFGCAVVLTGVALKDGRHANGVLAPDGAPQLLRYDPAPGAWPGTGDLFCAALAGLSLRGETLTDSAALAARFVRGAVQAAADAGADTRFGAHFESQLHLLMRPKEREKTPCSQ